MKDLRLPDEDIKAWLLSRKWVFHLDGPGDWQFARFVYFDPVVVDYDNRMEWPEPKEYVHNTLHLDREEHSTDSFVSVSLKLAFQPKMGNYLLKVMFYNNRAYDGYEQVFRGYFKDLGSLINIFRSLGVEEKHLT